MMFVAAIQDFQVQVHCTAVGNSIEKFFDHLRVQFS